jgi:hypothetical protein
MVNIIHVVMPLPGRLVQVGLALYLLPALLVVFAVGAVGSLVLAAGELCYGSLWRELHALREQVGQEIFRS